MNIEMLDYAVEEVKRSLGESLLACQIWPTEMGLSIAGYNSQPAGVALFNELTSNMISSLEGSGFPGLDKYYLLHLQNNHIIVVMYFEEHQWGFLIDSSKIKLGLFLSFVMPKARERFNSALKG